MTKRSAYYSKEDIANYKEWEKEITHSGILRKKYGVVPLYQTMARVEDGIAVPCPKCQTKLNAKFGDYSKTISAKLIECPMGSCETGHGWWMSVVNMILN